jgi:hypothetical protein
LPVRARFSKNVRRFIPNRLQRNEEMGMLTVLTMSFLLGLPTQDFSTARNSGEVGSRQAENDYALREKNAAPLEEFRGSGGGGSEALGFAAILAVGLVVAVLYFGVAALVKVAS